MKVITIVAALIVATLTAGACTSALVPAQYSATGRPLMWKHRDTGAEQNFVERVDGRGPYGYVALFNGGDSLLREAWMGMNDAGFAIMNTASYNLMPDTAKYKDREGELMSRALATCRTALDFEVMLQRMPKPMGVQANFGVMDADGALAYYETDDYGFRRYDATDSVTIRTNFSFSGNATDGMGYIRYDNARQLLGPAVEAAAVAPETFTELCSRSFWHSLMHADMERQGGRWVPDRDFIPRRISSASVVIEGMAPGEKPEDMVMWTVIGYPPVSSVQAVTLDKVPDGLRPLCPDARSALCMQAVERKRMAFPIKRGSGPGYIDMDYLRGVMPAMRERSLQEYRRWGRPASAPSTR